MSSQRARVLILEDRAPDRRFLSTLLDFGGYRVLEATNGVEGLAAAAAHEFDVVISDVLMPVMDGFEFVRRLRRTPGGADVPVIFYTATYHEYQARALAEECGVVEIMTKPSEPETILARVEAALARGRTRVRSISDGPFDRRHAQLTADTLVDKVRDLEISEGRMVAIAEIGQRFIEEREPVALLQRVCDTVREVTFATSASAGVFSEDLTQVAMVLTSGYDERTTAFLRERTEIPPLVRPIAVDRRPVRVGMPGCPPEPLGLPAWHAPVHSHMVVPMGSRGRLYGFFAVTGRLGAAEFTDADERIAVTLGVQAGIAYENAVLINELESQAAALRSSEALTDFALSAARIGIYQRDLVTNRILQSPALAEMLHVPNPATLEDIYASLHPDDRAMARTAVERAILDGNEFSFDARVADQSGGVSYLHVRGQILPDAAGASERLVSVVVDMTERRRLEAQLRQAQEMEAIGRLAGGVAHDFNNLLTAILGYSRFLLPTLNDDQQRNDVREIISAGEQATALTRQLLAFGHRHAEPSTIFDVNLVITDLVKMLRRLIGSHITLTTSLAESLACVESDRGQIEHVLMNLVVNARDAMPSGGEMLIETGNEMEDGTALVRLTVSDTGIGMTEETRAGLFERRAWTKDSRGGAGQGLADVFGIVSQAGGRVAVASTPGHGSRFTILLPATLPSVEVADSAEPALPGGTETVLIVEGEEAVRFVSRSILDRAGYDVREAVSLDDALRVARHTPPDILVTDVLLPGGTGPDLFRQLAAAHPRLGVLYISGYAPEMILDIRRLEGRAAFLAKPFTAPALAQRVREVLDR
jgi:signal transduction histidine kinase/DNA-binding response OmpR family regulator